MTRQELENWLTNKGYIRNKFGHYHKTLDNGKEVRFKMQVNSCRLERRVSIVDHNEWLKSRSGYYKDLSITTEDKLRGIN